MERIVTIEKKTSKEWLELVPKENNLKILNPDGWDRKIMIIHLMKNLLQKKNFK